MSSLAIGPHFYPRRSQGAQIIQRGPHGMRFGQSPSHDPRTGFNWWSEQITGDVWQPEQKVTGVMGLGSLGRAAPDASRLLPCPPGSPPRPVFPEPGPRDPARGVWAELNRATGAACRGRIEAANTMLSRGVDYFMQRVPAAARPQWIKHRAAAQAFVDLAKHGAPERLKVQKDAEAKFSREMQDWNQNIAPGVLARDRAEILAAQGGALSYATHLVGRDPVGAAHAAATGKPPPLWSSGGQSAYEEGQAQSGACAALDIGCHLRNHWWKAALALGGAVVLYGLATGAGKGLAGRIGSS